MMRKLLCYKNNIFLLDRPLSANGAQTEIARYLRFPVKDGPRFLSRQRWQGLTSNDRLIWTRSTHQSANGSNKQ